MEWSPTLEDVSGDIRSKLIFLGHIVTPMVRKILEEVLDLKEIWERESMNGRLAGMDEFKGAALLVMSAAST